MTKLPLMEFFRRINKRTLLLWSLLLCLALLCAQGVVLHVHSVDHGHGYSEYQSYSHAANEADDHAHMSKAHFAHDTSHNDHHVGATSDIDVSPDGLLKNSNSIFAVVVIAFLIALVIFVSSGQLVHRCRENKLTLQRHYVFSPPLRAPPQY